MQPLFATAVFMGVWAVSASLAPLALAKTKTPSAASAMPVARSLMLADALVIAARQNRSVLVARKQVQSATASLESAQATRFPTLSAGSSLSNPATGPVTQVGGSLTASYDMDTHGARGARIRLAELGKYQAEVGYAQTSQYTRLEATAAYYDLQQAIEQVRIAKTYLANAKTSVDDAETLAKAGQGTAFDVQRARVQLGSAEQSLATAEGDRTVAHRRLCRVLGLEPAGFNLVPSQAIVAVSAWKQDFAATLAQALKRRPELALRDLEKQSAEQQTALAWSARRIQTQMFARGEAGLVAGTPAATPLGAQPWPPQPDMTVGAQLSWLLWDWGNASNQARQAAISGEMVGLRKEDATLAIQLDVEQAYANMKAAQANIASAERALDMAKLGLNSARLRFKGGVGTQTDVLLAQQDLVTAEGNRVRAVLAFNKAIAQLEQTSAALGLPEGQT